MSRTRGLWALAVLAVALVVGFVVPLPGLPGGSDDSDEDTAGVAATAPPVAQPSFDAPSPEPTLPPGELTAPPFAGLALDGTSVNVAARWRERPMVISFVTSWCAQCQERQDALSELARTYDGEIDFVGVATQDSREALSSFAAQHTVGYPLILDEPGEVWRSYAIREPPAVVVVDRGGKLLRGWPGGKDAAALDAELKKLELVP
ncbi:TlpA family protein disulfide reductase [Motilibacter deserti]|uniref:TlpA family protein disulfide reductase n=1 Tax=Motilibacter deserti TaxID=2714956 RepID=A0ABX0GYV1_9ACTN|nr:TlpA family protein disulfide reductase [Motilibacter deserti]